MLFPRHPQPVVQQKAVATQVVQQRQESKAMDKHLLIVPARTGAGAPQPFPPPQPARED